MLNQESDKTEHTHAQIRHDWVGRMGNLRSPMSSSAVKKIRWFKCRSWLLYNWLCNFIMGYRKVPQYLEGLNSRALWTTYELRKVPGWWNTSPIVPVMPGGKSWIVLSLPFPGGFKEIWEYRATVINNFSFTFEIKARHISLIQFHLDEAAVLAARGNALHIIINITFRKM